MSFLVILASHLLVLRLELLLHFIDSLDEELVVVSLLLEHLLQVLNGEVLHVLLVML